MLTFFSSRILAVHSADEFYMTMGVLTQEMLDSNLLNPDQIIRVSFLKTNRFENIAVHDIQ